MRALLLIEMNAFPRSLHAMVIVAEWFLKEVCSHFLIRLLKNDSGALRIGSGSMYFASWWAFSVSQARVTEFAESGGYIILAVRTIEN